jgi:hypothetical protein
MNALLRFCGLAVLVLAAGCEDKNMVPADAGEVADSGPAKPALGGKLGAAVEAAEAGQGRKPAGNGGSKDGPPENGIFPPGGADAALAPTVPAKIEVISDGAEPRVALALALAGDEQKGLITTGVSVAQQGGLPPMDFSLSYKIDRPKDAKKDAAPGPLPIVVKVTSVAPGKEIAGRLPADAADAIGKLKGSEIRYTLAPNGVISGLQATLSKDADPKLDLSFRVLVEAITLFNVPLPDKPVGVGGYWMVTDHSTPINVDVVRYRVFHVQQIDKDKATLTVDLRQYSVKDEVDLGAITAGKKMKLDRFDSQGKAGINWSASSLLQPANEMSARVVLIQAGQRGGLPLDITASSGEPGKGDAKKK